MNMKKLMVRLNIALTCACISGAMLINELNTKLDQQRISHENQSKVLTQRLHEAEQAVEEHIQKYNETKKLIEELPSIEFQAEVTYYSPAESTNPPGWESSNCMGGQLQEGDWAAPDFIPLHSKILVTYEDGSQEIGTIVDRGNTDIIKIFTRDDEPILEGADMRLDKFVWNAEGKGLDIATVKIIRWGSGEDS